MQQEQMSPVDKTRGSSPDPVDVFMDRLIQRLTSLAIILVNIVFNAIAFREKR